MSAISELLRQWRADEADARVLTLAAKSQALSRDTAGDGDVQDLVRQRKKASASLRRLLLEVGDEADRNDATMPRGAARPPERSG